MTSRPHPEDDFWKARREHAFLLCAEGISNREIGERLGITGQRAGQLVHQRGHQLARAMRRTKFTFTGESHT